MPLRDVVDARGGATREGAGRGFRRVRRELFRGASVPASAHAPEGAASRLHIQGMRSKTRTGYEKPARST